MELSECITETIQERNEEQRRCGQCGLPTDPVDLIGEENEDGEPICLDCGVENWRDRWGELAGCL